MFGLFRTEPDAPKHAGISYLLRRRCASRASTVRPLRADDRRRASSTRCSSTARARRRTNIVGRARRGLEGLARDARARAQADRRPERDAAPVRRARRRSRATRGAAGARRSRTRRCASGSPRSRATCSRSEYTNLRMLIGDRARRAATRSLTADAHDQALLAPNLTQAIAALAYDLIGGGALLEPSDVEAQRLRDRGTTAAAGSRS